MNGKTSEAKKTEEYPQRQRKLTDDQMSRISTEARRKIDGIFKGSYVFADAKEMCERFPKFLMDELVQGKLLGRGQFGVVREIVDVKLLNEDDNAETGTVKQKIRKNSIFVRRPTVALETRMGRKVSLIDSTKNVPKVASVQADPQTLKEREDCMNKLLEIGENGMRSRQFISDTSIRKNSKAREARYAVKYLSEKNRTSAGLCFRATVDLAVEVHFLATLEHTNIMKLRGLALADLCSKDYFIVMDRLYGTLEEKLSEWKAAEEKFNGVKWKLIDPMGRKMRQLLDQRLIVAFDLAAAMKYLHCLKVMHRDLKPENIGFDVRGDVKIFDFGLAKELRHELLVDDCNYKLTGRTGSIRYMAPEVYKKEAYNEKADIYSFSLVLWMLRSLEKPFHLYNDELLFVERVIKNGLRPKIGEAWSAPVRCLINKGWSNESKERPSAMQFLECLKKELAWHRRGNESGLDDAHERRRSTEVLPPC